MQTLKQMFKTQTLLVQHTADVKHLQNISVAMGQALAKASGCGTHSRTGQLGLIAALIASFQLTDSS